MVMVRFGSWFVVGPELTDESDVDETEVESEVFLQQQHRRDQKGARSQPTGGRREGCELSRVGKEERGGESGGGRRGEA